MNSKEIKRILESKCTKNELVEIFRHEIDEMSFLSNVKKVSDKLVLAENTNDFSVNGYRIIRLKDITDISLSSENDSLAFLNMIFEKEAIFEKSTPDFSVNDWNDVFSFLCKSNNPVTVECAYEDAIDYYFGWVKSVNGSIATMVCFDGSGEIFRDEIKVNLDYVSQVLIFEKYTTKMSQYVRK